MHSTRHVWSSVVVLFAVLFALITVSPLASAQVPLQFVAVTPCRVVDTRWAPGPLGGPEIQGQTSRDFALPNGVCSIPNTAAAYSLNVTVVPHPTLGYLTVWPTGQPRPVLSTLNSPNGRVKANAAIVPAGDNEAISVFATDNTDVVLDIDGYFVPATSSTLAFFPLTPCRVADTRWPNGPLGGPTLQGRAERDFPVLSSSCNIPESAQGYSLNFTAVPRPTLGYLTVWPTGQAQPEVSTLNATTGVATANAAIVPSGTSGAISVYVTDNTDLIIDVDGYFAPSDSGQNPLSLYTLPPCRVLDTRHSTGTFSGMLPVTVLTSPCSVPSAEAYVLNATVIPAGGHPVGYLSLWPDAENQPVVSTLNAVDGALTSNMAIVPTLNGSIDAYVQKSRRPGAGHLQLLCAHWDAENHEPGIAVGHFKSRLQRRTGGGWRRRSLHVERNVRQLAAGIESGECASELGNLGHAHDGRNVSVHVACCRLANAAGHRVGAAEHHGERDRDATDGADHVAACGHAEPRLQRDAGGHRRTHSLYLERHRRQLAAWFVFEQRHGRDHGHAFRRRHLQLHGAGDGFQFAACHRERAPEHHHYTGSAAGHHHDFVAVGQRGQRLQRHADRHRRGLSLYLEHHQRHVADGFAFGPQHGCDLGHADHGGDLEFHGEDCRFGNPAGDRLGATQHRHQSAHTSLHPAAQLRRS